MTIAERARLPAEFSSFVGRAGEVAELAELLRSARAITLCGAGGIGKTRLALRLLTAVADRYPDGVWFIDLGEMRQPELVAVAVASVVGVDEEPGRPLTDTLADAVRHRQALLVLDNCEHLLGPCAAICRRLLAAAPDLRVVATSREPLHLAAEIVWPVPPLALPPPGASDPGRLAEYDAVQLFAERAAAVAPGFSIGPANAASIARMCRALDGLPLAIELAAAWVRVLSAEQIADRLADRFRILTSPDRSAPARQQTLRATLDWSYKLLSEPERILMRRLSVFAEWTLEMAEQVCADDELPAREMLDLITALADKSLIELGPESLGQARYRLLESVREYASGWLRTAGELEEFQRRRHDYVLREAEDMVLTGMAIAPGPWSKRVNIFRRYDAETVNLQEVLEQSLANGDAETGLRLCTAMSPVMIVRGNLGYGARWIDAFLALDTAAATPDSVRGPALAVRAQIALASGSGEAEQLAMAALELCWTAGAQFYAAAALNSLAEVALHAGRFDEAAARAAEVLEVARAAGDRFNEGYALGTMATVAGLRGSLREAQELSEQALEVMRAIEQHWGTARTLLGLGDLARLRGDHEMARQRYVEALGYLREVNSRPDTARCLAGLGRIAIEQGDLPTARQNLAESLRLSHASGSRIGMARGLEALARLAILEGSPQAALQLAGAVTTLWGEAGLPPMPGARTQRYLDAAAGLGQHVVARLWAEGAAMSSADAVRLALGPPRPAEFPAAYGPADEPATGRPGPGETATGPAGPGPHPVPHPRPPVPESLTAREREVVALIAAGKSNRAIGAELFISPATAARHVANILAKLGYTSRSQVAVWAASAQLSQARADQARADQARADQAGQLAPKRADTDSPS
jgi:predicted ATPase/DNA-binding CsgD family transcriptional regulator